ncbi:major facilitator superfamily domain-containing protein [Schizothecium vesticola]|uniref:Major facilitator superfamily domain-containing protein n=1 Tax=Schizothecium vesticola TaxID=314040 RepID=A0AA40KDH5_9PEZI|nr:major facilitator superfamily domain-containing protein [Schizothecium vesticola]
MRICTSPTAEVAPIQCHRSSSMKRLPRETRYTARRNITGATPLHKSSVPAGDVTMRAPERYRFTFMFFSFLIGNPFSEILRRLVKTASLHATQELRVTLATRSNISKMVHRDIHTSGDPMLETTHKCHEKTAPTVLVTEVPPSPSSSSCRSNDTETRPDPTIISFLPDDPENPHNWSSRKKSFIVLAGTLLCINSTMGSTLTSNMFPALRSAFSLPAQGPESVLAASVYLLGFMFGPLIFAPLSESHGRKSTLLVGFVLFTLSLLGAALAPSWALFLLCRFLTGTFGSPPISVVGGVIADVFCEEGPRGRVMMLWSGATVVGPVAAPILAGFMSPVGWRWTFWIALMVAALSFSSVVLLPETLATKILSVRAAKMNREAGSFKYATRGDLNRGSTWQFLKLTLSRPVRLLCTEMLLGLTCVYIGFIYAIFYMLVKIFPDIFQGIYGLSPGLSGVAFSVMGLGTCFGCIAALYYDTIAPRLSAKHPAKKPEYLRLPLACAAAPFFVVSLLWLGWTSRKDIHLMVPLAALLPYGFAYQMIFVAMINYLADSYEIYSASALAACGATRSIAGALIPLATDAMVDKLGVARACTVLAGVSAALGLVPVLFIVHGERIRAGSKFSAQIRAQRQVGGEGAVEGGVLGRSLSAV